MGMQAQQLLLEDGEKRNRTHQDTQAAEGRIILDAIDADAENLYIFDIFQQPTSMEDAFSCWEPKPAKYCENRFVLGGWEARHPYLTNLLSEQGITNPVTALFEKNNVYSMYSRRTLTHLRIHYYNRITMSETKTLCGYPLVQYAAPIDDALLIYGTGASAVLTHLGYSDKSDSAWYLQADVSPVENGTGVFYGLDVDFDYSNANIQIFQLMNDGSYVAYTFQ